MTEQRVLALIPARGGSQSIRGKNRRLFAGHPLVAYSIAAGLQADGVDRVVVSTDDPRIAEIGRKYGAEVPFMRPAELAQDDTLDLPVFQHALNWLADHDGYRPDLVVQLRPTSPVRPPDCVDRAVNLLAMHPEADSVRGVVPAGQNPFKMWRIATDGSLAPLLNADLPEPYNQPRQKLPPAFWQTGHIDAVRASTIRNDSMSGRVILPLELPVDYAVDIDTPADWARAEWRVAHDPPQMVWPGRVPRRLPEQVDLVVLDFDGVLTDNRVWVNESGVESVAANRSDGWGIARLQQAGIQVLVLSTESNPTVEARCRKLGVPCIQGVADKGSELSRLLAEQAVDPTRAVFVGNDVNDVDCFPLVGCALAVADAHPAAKAQADLVLRRGGGFGAVRELADMLIEQGADKETHA